MIPFYKGQYSKTDAGSIYFVKSTPLRAFRGPFYTSKICYRH